MHVPASLALRLRRCYAGGIYICLASLFCLKWVHAQDLSVERCEWTDCKQDYSTNADIKAEQNPARGLPLCTPVERAHCADQCHGLFDQEYNQCLQGCLKKICAEPVSEKDKAAKQMAGKSCLESESAQCVSQCSTETAAKKLRCRRSCLENKCPDASPYDAARESEDPGALKCERCRAEFQAGCARNCAIGSAGLGHGHYPGLERLGCEKLCLSGACSKSCQGRVW
jgi:hypothetical protein